MAKQPSKKSAKPTKKADGGKKKKKRVESYSTYIYKVLKQVRNETRMRITRVDEERMNSMIT